MLRETKKILVICVIEKEGKFLYVKRTCTGTADGFYMWPGGHVDEGESVLHAAVRELKEEVGIEAKEEDLEFLLVEPLHKYITFFFKVKKYEGTPQNMEPEKHGEVAFLPPDHPMIHPLSKKEIELMKKGISFFPNDNFDL